MGEWRKLTETEKDKLRRYYSMQRKGISIFFRIWQVMGCAAIFGAINAIIQSPDFWTAFSSIFACGFATMALIVFPEWLIRVPISRELNSVEHDTIRAFEAIVLEKHMHSYRSNGHRKTTYKVLVRINVNREEKEVWIDTISEAYKLINEGYSAIIITSDIKQIAYMKAFDVNLESITFNKDKYEL